MTEGESLPEGESKKEEPVSILTEEGDKNHVESAGVKKPDFPASSQHEQGKKHNIWLIVGVVLIIAVTSGLFFFGIKFKFILNDELDMTLEPLSLVLNSSHEPVNVTFTVQNNNFAQCKISCKFELIDISSNLSLYNEERLMGHKEAFRKDFIIMPPAAGSGKAFFTFKARCANINSIICPTDQKPRYKTSLVILDYSLTEEEQSIKPVAKKEIEHFLSSYKPAYERMMQLETVTEKIPDNFKDKVKLKMQAEAIREKLSLLQAKLSDLAMLWDNEDYYGLDASLPGNLSASLKGINNSLSELNDQLHDAIRLRNENVGLLETAVKRADTLLPIADYYYSQPSRHNTMMLEKISDSAEWAYVYYLTLDKGKTFSEESLNQGLKGISAEMDYVISDFETGKAAAAAALAYSISLIEIKSNSSVENNTENFEDLSCERTIGTEKQMKAMNEQSILFRQENYPESLSNSTFDAELASFQAAIAYKALILAKETIKGYFSNGDEILELLESKVSSQMQNNTHGLPGADFYKMAVISTRLVTDYNKDYCSDIGSEVNKSVSLERLAALDIGSLETKRLNETAPFVAFEYNTSLPENTPKCCHLGKCNNCTFVGMQNANPVLFIHGHAFSKEDTPEYSRTAFVKIQEKLEQDGYINAGEMDFSSISSAGWGNTGWPVSVRATYYYINYYDVGGYSFSAQKSEGIENYAIRLKELVEMLRYRTGSDKVDIVAHSMGGLVAREYINLFDSNAVGKLILVNTPNRGITNKAYDVCRLVGSVKECSDMREGSIFLKRLNSAKLPESSNIYSIRSVGCAMDDATGDGVVTDAEGYLEGAKNFAIKGNCTDAFNTNLHGDALDPDIYPETYSIIISVLKNGTG